MPRPLSPRRREVLGFMFMGKTNAEIATILGLSGATVKNHVLKVIRRYSAYNRQNAIFLALRCGELQPPVRVLPTPPEPLTLPAIDDWITVGNVSVSPSMRAARVNGQPLQIRGGVTFRILEAFARRPGMCFTRQQLLDVVYGDRAVEERAVDVYVLRLRKNLRALGADHTVMTERGVGYRFSKATRS